MAITNHLTSDNRLVNMAVTFTKPGGTCWLTHVESQPVFERYMDAVSKIPAIGTDVAREALAERLLKEPRDFITACRAEIDVQGLPIRIEEVDDYLLVTSTKWSDPSTARDKYQHPQ